MFILKQLLNYKIKQSRQSGFTLLEVLIALFIFSILSLIFSSALRTVINAQSGSENNAQRLRQVQMALLLMSRDIEQTVNRPVMDAVGKEELAFIGSSRGLTFTRAGFANPSGTILRSTLQRSSYYWEANTLWRMSWRALDQAPTSQSYRRRLLTDIEEVKFQFLDKDGRFHDNWPLDGEGQQPLPRAVKIYLTISNWGKMSQLYVISAQASKIQLTPSAPPPPKF